MKLVADRVKSRERYSESKPAWVQSFACFLAQGVHDQYGQNKIFAEVAELSDERVDQRNIIVG